MPESQGAIIAALMEQLIQTGPEHGAAFQPSIASLVTQTVKEPR